MNPVVYFSVQDPPGSLLQISCMGIDRCYWENRICDQCPCLPYKKQWRTTYSDKQDSPRTEYSTKISRSDFDINPEGKPHTDLYTKGSNLKGELWESTAVNELRGQAEKIG